jgi:uncharacterized membrane protein YedE/YeeE
MKPLSFIIVLFCGMLFGLGLSLSNMVIPEVVINFLLFRDLGLLLVLGSAVGVAALCYQLALRYLKSPLIEPSFRNRPVQFDWRTWLGSAIFGIGWGISGVCPGPAIAGLGVGNWPLIYVLAGIFLGAYVEGRWFSRLSGPSLKS